MALSNARSKLPSRPPTSSERSGSCPTSMTRFRPSAARTWASGGAVSTGRDRAADLDGAPAVAQLGVEGDDLRGLHGAHEGAREDEQRLLAELDE